jgi:hypothetical protein
MAMTAGAPVALPSHVAGPTAKRTKTIRMPPKVVVGDLYAALEDIRDKACTELKRI